jgi:cytoskeleton protein RodZ
MSQGPPAPTVGTRLRAAREKRGVSLGQIASSTRISVMSLEALERSDLSRLPGGIFTRAFVRAYAREVGLDPDRTIQDFIAELPPEAVTATAHSVALEDGEKLESDRRAVTTAFRLVLVSLPIIVLVMYYGTHRMAFAPESPETSAEESHAALQEPVEPSAATAAVPVTESAPVAVAAEPESLTMEIAPRASCWVSVTVDGEPTFSGLMAAGDRRVVSAKEQILVNVGDAGAFAYTLNGRPGRRLGAPGQVISKRITFSNLTEFTTP